MTDFDMGAYYGLFTYMEFGDDPQDLDRHLKGIRKLLAEKYGNKNFRVKWLDLCIIKWETHELDTQDKEWIRYILHAECYPEDDHKILLDELKERMEKGGK